MSTHPPTKITGGDSFIHDVYTYDENGNVLDLSGHTFTAKMRTKVGGEVIAAAAMTVTPNPGYVRIEMTAAATDALAAVAERGVYALRDDTSETTLITVEAFIEPGVAT